MGYPDLIENSLYNIERTFRRGGIVTIVVYIPTRNNKRININFNTQAFDAMDEDELEYRIERIIAGYMDEGNATKAETIMKVERCNQNLRNKERVRLQKLNEE